MTEAKFTTSIICASLDDAERLSEFLEAQITPEAIATAINEVSEERGTWEVVAYYHTAEHAEFAIKQAQHPGVVAPVPDIDWVARSLKGLAPVSTGRFLIHGSHDRHLKKSRYTTLEIDAGTAFGTGHHGTTAGCLAAFDTILKSGKPQNVFDLGCGTGVLALAAARATSRRVLASDIDPEAAIVTRQNAKLNDLSHLLHGFTARGLHHPTIRKHAPYDLIFANILARPLVTLSTGLARVLAPGGHLILSGITSDQTRWIRACYINRGLRTERILQQSNWMTLVFSKP